MVTVILGQKLNFEEDGTYKMYSSEEIILNEKLLTMISQGNINEAENLLYKKMDITKISNLFLALNFYDEVNNFDETFLENNNYSREEILAGVVVASFVCARVPY